MQFTTLNCIVGKQTRVKRRENCLKPYQEGSQVKINLNTDIGYKKITKILCNRICVLALSGKNFLKKMGNYIHGEMTLKTNQDYWD